MSECTDYERNRATYGRLKDTIDRNYARGWFIGINDDQIVGDAATFPQLEQVLRERGHDPRTVLVVEAGVEYPEYLTIFA